MAAEMTGEYLSSLLTTSEVAEMFDTSPRIVRREAKKGNIPGFIEVLGQFGFDPDEVEEWEVPQTTSRGRGRASRGDGRLRWKVWLTTEEQEELASQGYEIEDPRAKARARRAARKAAKAQAQSEEVNEADEANDDPFADLE